MKNNYYYIGKMSEVRLCTKCSISKEITDFYVGISWCKKCHIERSKARYIKLKEEHKNDDVKTCTKCLKDLKATRFYPGKERCKKCHSESVKERSRKIKESDATVKTCKNCLKEYPVANFYAGISWCKKCNNERHTKYYRAFKEKHPDVEKTAISADTIEAIKKDIKNMKLTDIADKFKINYMALYHLRRGGLFI